MARQLEHSEWEMSSEDSATPGVLGADGYAVHVQGSALGWHLQGDARLA